jgi:hypothetical protein
VDAHAGARLFLLVSSEGTPFFQSCLTISLLVFLRVAGPYGLQSLWPDLQKTCALYKLLISKITWMLMLVRGSFFKSFFFREARWGCQGGIFFFDMFYAASGSLTLLPSSPTFLLLSRPHVFFDAWAPLFILRWPHLPVSHYIVSVNTWEAAFLLPISPFQAGNKTRIARSTGVRASRSRCSLVE